MIKKILLTFLLILIQTVLFGATNTYTGANNGDWNTASNWSTGFVPTTVDDVVVPSPKTINISANSFAKTVSVSGTLKINDAIRLTVGSNFTVNSGGSFFMPTGSGLAELAVYGNYINNGLTDFWKSTVVITGDLLSPQTSTLQKQGNVIVGGNIIGVFDTSGGNGTGQIYAVDPNATVTITPITIDGNVTPGIFPSGENQVLIDFVNLIVYGGSCSFTINDIASVSACSGSDAVFTVSTLGGSPTCQWQVNTSGSGWVDLANNSTYSGVSAASLTITGVTISMNSYKYRAKITSASCTKSGNYGILSVNSTPVISTQPITQLDCEGASVNFTAVATGTGLTYTWQRKKPTDGSFITIPSEGNVSYPSTGVIKVDNVGSSQSPSGTQYQVVATNSGGCSVTSTPATLLVNEIIGVTGSTTITQCYGTGYSYAVTTSTPSPGYVVSYQWKSSVTSGVWNNVANGIHFTGATTATLSIINGTPSESAEYRVYVTFHSSGADCNVNSSSRSRTITFLPQVTAPVATITQPACAVPTGSLVLSGLPASGTWTLTRSGTSSAVTTGTGTSATISGLATGTYNYTVFNGTCTSVASSNVVINAQPGTPSTPTITSFTYPTFADNDGTLTLGNLPSGSWVGHQIKDGGTPTNISGTGTPFTITGLAMGSYEFEVVELCISPRSTPAPLTTVPYTPLVSAATAINCTGFIANWPATPTATAYLLDVSTVSNFASFIAGYQDRNVGNVLTFPVTGMPTGLLYYRIHAKNATQISLYSATITVTPLINTYSGNWSLGTPPTTIGTQNLVFNAGFTAATDLAGCSCTINSGNVIIDSGKTLTITNGVTIAGGASLTFEDSASLVQINNVANTGNITYKRYVSIRNTDYTYWSSPVYGYTLGGVSQNKTLSDKYYSFNASVDNWQQESAATFMTAGVGYIIRGPEPVTSPLVPPPPGLYTASFVGAPNNGTKTIAIGPTGTSNLLGNPYPSAINADAFLATNGIVIEGTIYFWTHSTAIQLASNITGVDEFGNPKVGSGVLAYTSDDYASYNGTGGAATTGGVTPTGKIAAGQAFFTTSLGAGTVTFNNAMRLSSVGATLDNNQFFKTKNPKGKTANTIEKNRVWLNLTNTKGAFKQTLIGYVTDATNDYDSRFDGESFDANEFADFYSVNLDKNLVIQGRALPFDENDEVPLGYRTTIEGNFTINIDETDGLLKEQAVFLEDKLTKTIFDLKSGNYTFNTTAGTFDNRFVLKYSNKTLGTNDLEVQANKVLVSIKSKQIKINSFSETIDKVTIYDLLGRQIYQKVKVNSYEFLLTDFSSSHQTLIVKTSLKNGTTVTDKIIY